MESILDEIWRSATLLAILLTKVVGAAVAYLAFWAIGRVIIRITKRHHTDHATRRLHSLFGWGELTVAGVYLLQKIVDNAMRLGKVH